MSSVFDGIRVLDFGRYIAAPNCGMMLADMGADVIRVGRRSGADNRRFGLKVTNGETSLIQVSPRTKGDRAGCDGECEPSC